MLVNLDVVEKRIKITVCSTVQDPFVRLKKNVDASIKSLDQEYALWRNFKLFGKSREQDTKDKEVVILKKIYEIQQLVTELEGKVEDAPEEIGTRKNFIAEVKNKLHLLQNAITTAQSNRKINEDTNEPLVSGNRLPAPDEPKVDAAFLQQQQDIKNDQEAALERIHGKAIVFKDMAKVMDQEIDVHNKMIVEIKDKVDNERERLKAEDKFLAKLLKASREKKSWVAIIILGILLAILVVVAFST